MTRVEFHDEVKDELLKYAVVVSKAQGKWVFCKHKQRDTFEVPGGHREEAEDILAAAKRELYEETGAISYSIQPVCVYAVTKEEKTSYGMLYYAEIDCFEKELHSEIEKIILMEKLPDKWTYPDIQPKLIEEVKRRGIV